MNALPFADEIQSCRIAQAEWNRLSVGSRVPYVRRLRHLLAEYAEDLALNVTQDIGRSAEEVLASDILPTADACRFVERNASKVLKPTYVPITSRPLWLYANRDVIHRRPHGIVGIIGTWNYPIFLNVIQIVQALVAGNGVLWKPSELIPATARRIHDLIIQAKFPANLFIRLPDSREAGPQLAEADIDHIIFTGSAETGRKLARRLGERLISSTLELSGNDAMIVLANADMDFATKAAWFGSTINKGQTCLAVRRAFVHQDRYEEFLNRLKPLASNVRAEPLALWSQAQQAEDLVHSALKEGAKLLVPGESPKAENDPPRFPPTVVVNARPEMAICQQSSFAPIMTVLPYRTLQEVAQLHRQCEYGLGASIFGTYGGTAEALASALQVGVVSINDVIVPTAHPATPFGGRRASGWGVTQGAEGLLQMTVPQVVSNRVGTFRPYYDSNYGSDPANKEMIRGMINWSHGRGIKRWWKGVWQMLRAIRKGFGMK
jgi:acyl-CoA reductase-like NAD-dependent aldehyde dehydrogenase